MQAQTWRCRPSELAGIEDPYEAYCFDEAIGTFGNFVRGELAEVEGDNPKATSAKQELLLKALLSDDVRERYAAPEVTA